MGPIRGDPSAVRRTVLTWAARWLLLVAVGLGAARVARPLEDRSGGGTAARPPAATVEITDGRRFSPGRVRVRVGDDVLWRNATSFTHTVTDDGSKARLRESWELPAGVQGFDSGGISPGGTWRYRFTTPGTYRYFCQPHEAMGMTAVVEVER